MIHSLATGYNPQLVSVSIAIAVLASYTALDLAGRVTATQGRAQIGWLLSGSVTMGIGIWAMHFIGMLAFQLPVPVHYDFLTVLASVLPAIIASGLALFVVSRSTLCGLRLVSGSVFMGLGIASMHYLGMAAMHPLAVTHYDLRVVGLSNVIAIAVSFAGLFLVFQFREETTQHPFWKKLLAAILIGAAIFTMHYTGMAAAYFIPLSDVVPKSALQPPEDILPIAAAVVIATLIVLGLALLTAFFDRRLSAQISNTEALQESQRHLKTILEGIQVGVLVIETDGQVQVSNQAMLDLLHLSTPEELQHLWNSAVTHNPDPPTPNLPQAQAIQPVLQKIAAKQPVWNAVIDIAGSAYHQPTTLLVNAVPLKRSDGSKTQTVCTFSEITNLKQTETRLTESEAKFKDLAKQEELLNYLSTQIRQSLDLPTILQTAVCEVRQFFETDRALIYQFDASWRGQVVLEDVVETWLPTLGEAADDCFPQEYLERYRNGTIRSINNILDAGLNPDHFRFLQRLQVQANLIVPIMVRNQLWGLLIVHQCDRPRIWTKSEGNLLLRLAIQLGIAIQQSDLYTQAQQSALQSQAQALQLQESETQLKQQAQALQQTLQDLQRLQLKLVQNEKMSSLGQLVAGVAHEINNPVNFIHGNLSYVQDYGQNLLDLVQLYQKHYPNPDLEIQAAAEAIDVEFLQDDLAKILTSMKVGTDRIRQIVLSLRNFSRMDEAEFKAVDIHQGIDSTLMILQHRLKATPERPAIEVIRDYGNLPLVECYPGQLNQVFMNVLANALDVLEDINEKRTLQENKDNPSQIAIRTALIENQCIQIAIADNGSGMPETVRERIFEPFFTTKPIGKGTGMGLSISYQIIVEKHSGKLECFSAPNQGTEFLIQIPIQQ